MAQSADNKPCSALGVSFAKASTLAVKSPVKSCSASEADCIKESDLAAFVQKHRCSSKIEPKRIHLPLNPEQTSSLHAGDFCLLEGELFVLRDAGHMRLMQEIAQRKALGIKTDELLPYGLKGACIFYAGPSPACANQVFGAIGPTTASRMDFAAADLYDLGIVATLGKGYRSEAVVEAICRNKATYFVAVGGAASLLAKAMDSAQVCAYEDLGCEALRKVHVKDLPVFVGLDSTGADIYRHQF